MSSTHPRRALRAVIVLALATATVAGASQMAFSDGEADDITAFAEATDGQTDAATDTMMVPAVVAAGERCSTGWSWFENPLMHLGFCVPPGWGFSDFSTATPMTQIPGRQLTDLHLLSAGAFPWSPGRLPFDVIRERGIVDVEFMLLEPEMRATTECEPSQPRLVRGLRLLTCEQAYDDLGLPAATGALRATKVVVPLLSTPSPLHPSPSLVGARLLVIVRTSDATPSTEVNLVWKLVDSITPF